MILEKKLDNQSGQAYSYMTEQLARVRIDIAPDGTITLNIVSDTNWDENFLQIASQSSGIPIKL